MKRFLPRFRILPVLVLVSMLSFSVRLSTIWSDLHEGEAAAQEKVQVDPPPMPADAKKPMPGPATEAATKIDVKPDAAAAAKPAEGKGPALPAADSGQKVQWHDASEEQFSCSDTAEKLNQDLAKRRADLDKQASELATRQALSSAAQHELDQKVAEMTNLRNQIQGMMSTLSEQEKARIASLVKIYEGMKPADAARIFNTLDMDVMIEVMSQMKEAKAAPVLAAMDSARAKSVTVMLAQQKKLPDVPAAPSAP